MLLDCNPVLDEIYSGDLSLFAAIGDQIYSNNSVEQLIRPRPHKSEHF